MSEKIPTSSARLSCLCGAISLPGSYIRHDTFPIPPELCHCNTCRYATGGLLPMYPPLKTPPPDDIKAKLAAYQFSDLCVRYFCPTCGSHCFAEHLQVKDEWYCTGGIIEPPAEPFVKDVIDLDVHNYILDTGDGGTVPLFLPITKPTSSLFGAAHGVDPMCTEDLLALAKTASSHAHPGPSDKLSAKCHCGGVDLLIARADYAANPPKFAADLIPKNPNKYVARFCACRSCRLSLGFSLVPWLYVPASAITNAKTGKPVLFKAEAKENGANEGLKLQHYDSSDGVLRSFCSGCGASVFFVSADPERGEIVDISVGLLRADSGAMAREWAEWAEGEVSHEEDVVDRSQLKCIKSGKV